MAAAMPFDQPIRCPTVIGRESQLAALRHTIDLVDAGAGKALLLAGEAGIGKSRLVAEVKSFARERNWHILEGHAFEPERVLPYAPLLDLLRDLCAPLMPSALADLLGDEAHDLARILPELRRWLPDLEPAPALDPAQERRLAMQAIVAVARRLASRQPVLAIIEDLHWSDDTSLDALLQLARQLADVPLFLLLTYRDDEITPELGHFLATVDREHIASELALTRLGREEVGAMLGNIFTDAQPVDIQFQDMLHGLTDGNPFFIEEILKALATTGGTATSGGLVDQHSLDELQVPRSVQDAVQRRVDQLSADARHLLQLAAVAGRYCDFALLEALTDHDEEELLGQIKQLTDAQLLIEEASDRFVFRHALTRQAIYSALLGREQRRLHHAIVEVLEQLYGESDETHLAELAYHAYEAGDWQQALDYASRAGAQAQALFAPRSAVEQLTRALDAALRLSRTPAPQLHRARGLAYDTLGDFEHARADFEAALAAARQLEDQHAEWEVLIDLGLLWAARDYEQCGAYCQQALSLARTLNDPAELAQSLNRVGNWYANVAASPREALPHHHEALEIFEQLGDQRGVADTVCLLGTAYTMVGDLPRAAACYGRAMDLFRALNYRQGLAETAFARPVTAGSYLCDAQMPAPISVDETLTYGELGLNIAREIGWRAGEALGHQALGAYAARLGHYDRAFEHLDLCIAIAQEIGHRQWKVAATGALGHLYVDLFATEAARQCLLPNIAEAREIGSRWFELSSIPALAGAYLREHDLDAAVALIEAANLSPIALSNLSERNCWMIHAAVLVARGDATEALTTIDELIATAPGVTNERQVPRLARIRGEALTRLGRFDEAEQALRASQAGAEETGRCPFLWRALVALGHLYRTQRRYSDADDAFSQARAIIAELAERVPDPDLRGTFLRAAAALMPAPRKATKRRAAKQAFGGLTEREREVAALVAGGLSNRDIAARLFVSERTVATHISHILGKLQCVSRTQIATWAVDVGLVSHA